MGRKSNKPSTIKIMGYNVSSVDKTRNKVKHRSLRTSSWQNTMYKDDYLKRGELETSLPIKALLKTKELVIGDFNYNHLSKVNL